MTGNRITLLGSLNDELQSWLCDHPDGHERGAFVLFRCLSRTVKALPKSDRFMAVETIKLVDDWIIDSSETHLKINMRKLPEVYFRCETENLHLGFVHNHPNGYRGFSVKDNINELNILRGLSGSNGEAAFLVSMVLHDGKWQARIRQGTDPNQIIRVRHISVLSDKIELHGFSGDNEPSETLKRQEAAFGKPFNTILNSLRAAVIGVGGTGSPLATLLARAGIGELILIDGDDLEGSNLNRVRGFRSKDIGKNKALILADYINSLELKNLSVAVFDKYLNESPEALDALSSADVVFGCTDDVAGRDFMNQALYYYAQALIDVGLTGKIDVDSEGSPYLRDHRGRVSCILPEHGACLCCQRVVTQTKLDYEQATKDNPQLAKLDAETLAQEYYLTGGGEQAPGVGPFTSGSADNAVATFMNLIKPYRCLPDDLRQDNIWIDFVHMEIHSNTPVDNPECDYCRLHTFLLRDEEKYRLEIPLLGEINGNS